MNKLYEFKRQNKDSMVRRIINISQVIDALDRKNVSFYSGKSNEKDEIPLDIIRGMKPEEVKDLIKNNLIIKIGR